jgi:hypothetical protein
MNSAEGHSYEKSDVNVRKIVGFTLAVIAFLATVLILLNEYFLYSKEELVYETVLKPESVALRDLRAQEEEVLTTYRLLDASKGIYQIPVERAMKLLADEAYAQSR